MPLVGFKPTQARLVMEHGKDSVLVMKVVVDDDDGVELVTGGTLQELGGVLRIRERSDARNGSAAQPIGSLVYVDGAEQGADATPAKYQINVYMAADKFGTLLRTANAGRLPSKFMVDAGERSGPEMKALGYRVRAGARAKVWDNHAHRVLPVTHFVMILPIEVMPPSAQAAIAEPGEPLSSTATNAQVAELMDDMVTFQSDTRNTMFGLVCVIAIVALAALALGVANVFR